MNPDQNKIINETVVLLSDALNSVPTGQVIPSSWQAPNDFTYEKFSIGHIPVECLYPTSSNSEYAILQLHGGAFAVGLIDPYREVAIQYSKLAHGAKVYTIDYRVAPTDLFPCAIEDATATYKWLIERGQDPNKIIFIGDSAGGNLALSTCLYLKDHDLPLPKLLILLSPWANPNGSFSSVTTNDDKDAILGINGIALRKEVLSPSYYLNADYSDPYVSPVLGDYTNFPDMLIQVGSYERLLDDALEVEKVARQSNVKVTCTIYEEMSHDFPILIPTLEASQQAWKEIGQFLTQYTE